MPGDHYKDVMRELQVETRDATYVSRTYNDQQDRELMAMVVPTETRCQALRQEGYPAVTREEWQGLTPEEQRARMWVAPAKLTRRFTGVMRGISQTERQRRQQ